MCELEILIKILDRLQCTRKEALHALEESRVNPVKDSSYALSVATVQYSSKNISDYYFPGKPEEAILDYKQKQAANYNQASYKRIG